MNLNKKKATADDKDRILRAISWCEKYGMSLNGFNYDDPLAGADGIHLAIIVPEGTPDEVCAEALEQGYYQNDVVSHSVVECPADWFGLAKAS